MFADLEGQVEKIYLDGIELIYYMRGAITLFEMFEMTPVERNVTAKFLNRHLEREFKRPHPNY